MAVADLRNRVSHPDAWDLSNLSRLDELLLPAQSVAELFSESEHALSISRIRDEVRGLRDKTHHLAETLRHFAELPEFQAFKCPGHLKIMFKKILIHGPLHKQFWYGDVAQLFKDHEDDQNQAETHRYAETLRYLAELPEFEGFDCPYHLKINFQKILSQGSPEEKFIYGDVAERILNHANDILASAEFSNSDVESTVFSITE
ncbi:hypothetical protein F5Y16DRAFT_391325 [Xylariaceae sp. FL0255]|nr:hypothetical protein F5Y16DRAFT_391325 [Xylariaceae sp. FL0255]